MRLFKILVATSCLLAAAWGAAKAADPAAGASKLNGWGPFKFGMTPDEAHTAPDVSWKKSAADSTAMTSLPMASEYAPDTLVTLKFNGDQKLTAINLSFQGSQSAAECEKAFQDSLKKLQVRYGAFAAEGDKDAWSIDDALTKGSDTLERTSVVNAPGGHSRYWRRAVLPNIAGLNLEADAKRVLGPRAIEVTMFQKDGKESCHQGIAFTAAIPTKAELETEAKLAHVPANMDWHWAELDHVGRGFSSGPAQAALSSGVAENVKIAGGKFTADLKRPAGRTVHLVGAISKNKISAHASEASEDFPSSFAGTLSLFTTDGEPVDAYEVSLTGTGRWASAALEMTAYHRNAPHAPTPEACRKVLDDIYAARGTVREMAYRGFHQALGCTFP